MDGIDGLIEKIMSGEVDLEKIANSFGKDIEKTLARIDDNILVLNEKLDKLLSWQKTLTSQNVQILARMRELDGK